MEKKKSAKIKGYVRMTALVLAVILLAAMPMLASRGVEETGKASILSGTAQRRTIERQLIAGGSLGTGECTDVELPYGVKVRQLIAHNGDIVKEGDPIAAVDKVSVMTAVTQVQDALDATDKDMRRLSYSLDLGSVTVDEDGTIYSGGKAIAEDKMADYAKYLSLAQQHRDYEEIMVKLFLMYQNGTINAPADGLLDGLDTSVVEKLSAGEDGYFLQLLAAHVPVAGEDGEITDETDEETYYGNVGLVCAVVNGQWDMLVDPWTQEITDFADPKVDTSRMTATMVTEASEILVYTAPAAEEETPSETEPEAEEEEEKPASGWSVGTAQAGDVLLFVDGWVIKVGTKEVPGANQPGRPTQNNTPSNMEEALQQAMADAMAGLGGFSRSGMGGYGSAQQETELYSKVCKVLCRVVPQDTVTLTVTVDEQDILKLESGMEASVVFDAIPEETFAAVVTKTSKFGTSNGGSSKFEVQMELPYSEGMLPGMNATATLTMEAFENVVTVPAAALAEQLGQTLVYTGYDEKNEALTAPVAVQTGVSDGENVQILSGLEEGTPFWYSYYDKVEISNAVRPGGRS